MRRGRGTERTQTGIEELEELSGIIGCQAQQEEDKELVEERDG